MTNLRSSNHNSSLANLALQVHLRIKASKLCCLRLLWILIGKGRCIDTYNHGQQSSDWLPVWQQQNHVIDKCFRQVEYLYNININTIWIFNFNGRADGTFYKVPCISCTVSITVAVITQIKGQHWTGCGKSD